MDSWNIKKMPSVTPDFDKVATLLANNKIFNSVSELHGIICGQLCADGKDSDAALTWQLLGQENKASKIMNDLIVRFQLNILEQLNSEDYSFQLLLPDDDVPLLDRSRALAEWCGGYVMGLLESGIKEFDKLPVDAAEVAKDLVEISQLDTSEDNSGSDSDLMHLEEYVRVGVQILYAVLTNNNDEVNGTYEQGEQ